MSGVNQAVFMNQRSFGPTVIGEAFGGGYYAGQISTTANSVPTHYLIVAPKSGGESSLQWKTANNTTSGTTSVIDGPGNTAAMISAGAAAHPAANFCNGLTIGGYSDWYMPAKNELEVCYYNLKPGTTTNSTSSGTNTNAVPSRGSNYTSGTPAQTSVTDFQTGNTEAFDVSQNWSSTQVDAVTAWDQSFNSGNQANTSKNGTLKVRAIRRIAV